MKEIVCDRCGARNLERQDYLQTIMPLVKIYVANNPMEIVSPRQIDLCKKCAEELLDWLDEVKEG